MKTKADITDAAVTVYLYQLLSFRRHIWIRDGLWWNPFVTFLCNKVCLKQNPLACCITHIFLVINCDSILLIRKLPKGHSDERVPLLMWPYTHTLLHTFSLSHTHLLSHRRTFYPHLSLSLHTLSHIHTHSVSHSLFCPPPTTHTDSHTSFACTHTQSFACIHRQNEMPCPVKMFIYTDGHYSCSNTPVMLRMKIVREQPNTDILQLAYSTKTHIALPL